MAFSGGWQTCSGCGPELFSGTNAWSNVTGDTATLTFTGTQPRLYGVRDPRQGIGAVSIGGGVEVKVDFYNATRQEPSWCGPVPALAPGTHIFRLRVTGTRNASATDTFVVPDRLDVVG
jgi:hypothetical protein